MTPDLLSVLAEVQQDLGDVIDQIDQLGAVYARDYVRHHYEGGAANRPPQKPRDLHPMAAAIIRDLVLERATVARMGAVEASPRRAAQRRREGAL